MSLAEVQIATHELSEQDSMEFTRVAALHGVDLRKQKELKRLILSPEEVKRAHDAETAAISRGVLSV